MDKRAVRLGSAVLGKGRPAVCIPVMGGSLEALESAAEAAMKAQADVIELRADSLSAMPDVECAQAMCHAVRGGAPGIPVLFTLRTKRDGGPASADAAAYEALLCGISALGPQAADAIDVELSIGEEAFVRIAAAAHASGIAVIGSSHDFSGTPSEEEICARLVRMEQLGADVCKIAVMPQRRLDVLTLMRACVVSDEALHAPVIAIAMGKMGMLTRVGCEVIGSCLTFGTALEASAPGQIEAGKLRGVLKVIHDSL